MFWKKWPKNIIYNTRGGVYTKVFQYRHVLKKYVLQNVQVVHLCFQKIFFPTSFFLDLINFLHNILCSIFLTLFFGKFISFTLRAILWRNIIYCVETFTDLKVSSLNLFALLCRSTFRPLYHISSYYSTQRKWYKFLKQKHSRNKHWRKNAIFL